MDNSKIKNVEVGKTYSFGVLGAPINVKLKVGKEWKDTQVLFEFKDGTVILTGEDPSHIGEPINRSVINTVMIAISDLFKHEETEVNIEDILIKKLENIIEELKRNKIRQSK